VAESKPWSEPTGSLDPPFRHLRLDPQLHEPVGELRVLNSSRSPPDLGIENYGFLQNNYFNSDNCSIGSPPQAIPSNHTPLPYSHDLQHTITNFRRTSREAGAANDFNTQQFTINSQEPSQSSIKSGDRHPSTDFCEQTANLKRLHSNRDSYLQGEH
jgi:hypothetical protein